jgi:hypothetical protein
MLEHNYLAWNYTKNGVFSVKSTYHLKQQIKQLKDGRAGSSPTVRSIKVGYLSGQLRHRGRFKFIVGD